MDTPQADDCLDTMCPKQEGCRGVAMDSLLERPIFKFFSMTVNKKRQYQQKKLYGYITYYIS